MSTINRAQKVRLGIFVGTGVAILLGAFTLLAGRALLEHRDFYKIRYSNKNTSFSGLEPGSDVKYSGIKIGRVETLNIARDDVSVIEVTISITAGTPIAEDSTASLGSAGITGMKYVDVSRGSAKARVRKPGDTIPAGDSMIDELTARATSVAQKLEDVLVNVKQMTGPETQANFQKIMVSASGMLDDNRKVINEIVNDAHKVTTDMAVLSKRGVSVAVKADKLMSELQAAGGQVQSALKPDGTVMGALGKADKLVERMNMLILRSEGDLDITLRHMREASANLSDFSLALKENPTILINNSQPTDDQVGR